MIAPRQETKLLLYQRIFGEAIIKTVTDSLEENPTFNICQEIADEIKRILGDKRVDQLSEDEREAIRSKIEFFEHGEHWYWNTYIRPVRKTLGEAAVQKIDLVLDHIITSEENFQDHILVIEHELVRAMEEFEEGWTDENIHSQVDLGHNIQLWTHESAQKILVVPSFFLIVAPNTSTEHKMNAVNSMIRLLVHLLEVEMIDDERFDRELDLLERLSMLLQEDSYYEARNKFLPQGYCQGPPKNNRNVFGNIGTFGIPTAIGQALAHLLDLKVFEQLLHHLYDMEIPTPYNPEFVCRGPRGKGCCAETTPNGNSRYIFCVAAHEKHHPAYRRFLCECCRRSDAFYTYVIECLENKQTLTEEEGDLLKKYLQRRDKKREQRRKHYHEKLKDTAKEKRRNREQQKRRNNDPEYRSAKSERQKASYEEQKANGDPPQERNCVRYTKCRGVKYPFRLGERLMFKGLLLYLLKCGEDNMDTNTLFRVLRAILIEYQNRFPNENVIEYYVRHRGKGGRIENRPIYFYHNFLYVVRHYMEKVDRHGNKRKKLWYVKEDILSEDERREAKITRSNSEEMDEEEDLIRMIVGETFDENVTVPEEKSRHLPYYETGWDSELGNRLSDQPPENFGSRWIPYTSGTELSCE